MQERGEAVALRQQHRVAAARQEAHLQPILRSTSSGLHALLSKDCMHACKPTSTVCQIKMQPSLQGSCRRPRLAAQYACLARRAIAPSFECFRVLISAAAHLPPGVVPVAQGEAEEVPGAPGHAAAHALL